jgi:hypothetical protein
LAVFQNETITEAHVGVSGRRRGTVVVAIPNIEASVVFVNDTVVWLCEREPMIVRLTSRLVVGPPRGDVDDVAVIVGAEVSDAFAVDVQDGVGVAEVADECLCIST